MNKALGDAMMLKQTTNLEPTPFRDDTTLELSSTDLQGNYHVVGLDQQTNNYKRVALKNQPRSHPQYSRARRDQHLAILDPHSDSYSELIKPRFRWYQKNQWDQQYQKLLKFKERYGHCYVPHTCKESPHLARWAKRQRYQYKRKQAGKQSSMTASRQQKLDKIGFVWDLKAKTWEERFHELVEYKRHNGDCQVPVRDDENPTLATWVKCMKQQYKIYLSQPNLSRLTLEQFRLLTNLGFGTRSNTDTEWTVKNNVQKERCGSSKSIIRVWSDESIDGHRR